MSFIRQHPTIKNFFIFIIIKLGLYNISKKLYHQLRFKFSHFLQADPAEIDPQNLTPEAQKIYQQLKIALAQKIMRDK